MTSAPSSSVPLAALFLCLFLSILLSPATAGELVLVGGGLEPENEAIYRRVLDHALARRPVCVLPTASAEPAESTASYLADFERYGGEGAAVGVELTKDDAERADDPSLVAELEACGGFFFTGGDQSRIVDVLRPRGRDTPALTAVRRVLAAGGVVAGTSAGAAMVSDPMIGGGTSEDALRHGVAGRDGAQGVWVRAGLGLLPEALVDQHVLARPRLGRLLVAVARAGHGLGLGLDEDTALVITEAGTRRARAEVVGTSSVLVVDLSAAEGDGFDGARLWLLGDGDRLDLAERRPHPAAAKRPVVPGRRPVAAPADPWHDDVLHTLLVDLAMSGSLATTAGEGVTGLRLREAEGFRALSARRGEGRPADLFAGPFVVERLAPPAGSS